MYCLEIWSSACTKLLCGWSMVFLTPNLRGGDENGEEDHQEGCEEDHQEGREEDHQEGYKESHQEKNNEEENREEEKIMPRSSKAANMK